MVELLTLGGTWKLDPYRPYINDKYGDWVVRGCEISILFNPAPGVSARKIGLIQTSRGIKNGKPHYGGTVQDGKLVLKDDEQERKDRANTKEDGDQGRTIDQGGSRSPVYGLKTLKEGAGENPGMGDFIDTDTGNSTWGFCHREGGQWNIQDAFLRDRPKTVWEPGVTCQYSFETAAICAEGDQQGVYYGSISWGFEVDEKGGVVLDPAQVVSLGTPSDEFKATSARWNDQSVKTPADEKKQPTVDIPLPQHQTTSTELAALLDMNESDMAILFQERQSAADNANEGLDKRNASFEAKALPNMPRRARAEDMSIANEALTTDELRTRLTILSMQYSKADYRLRSVGSSGFDGQEKRKRAQADKDRIMPLLKAANAVYKARRAGG